MSDQSVSAALSAISNKPGWPLRVAGQLTRTLALAELGDPRGLATIFHLIDGTVHALAPDGESLWPRRVLVTPSFNSTTPATADLDEDGRDETVIAVIPLFQLSQAGSVVPGWPLDLFPDEGFQSLRPLVARLVAGEPPRILAASGTLGLGRIHALDTRGDPLPGWPVTLPPASRRSVSHLAAGDVTGDGDLEVVALDFRNSRILVYNHHGQLLPPFPVPVGLPGTPEEPTLADLDGDGAAEIVFSMGFRIVVFKGDGTLLPGWPQPMLAAGNFGMALGDVDGDGDIEVMASSINGSGNFEGGVYVWHGDGTLLPGWPKIVRDVSFAAHTIIADVDGDGQGDLVASGLAGRFLTNGVIYAWKSSGELIPGFPITLGGSPILISAPSVADIDRDGIADLGVMSEAGPGAAFVHWFDLGVPYRPEGMEWPTAGHDMARTGAYSPPVQPVELRPGRVELHPDFIPSNTPATPLTAVLTLPDDATLVPNALRLVEVDGTPVAEVVAYRRGGVGNLGTAGTILFQFDGRAVRAVLGATGPHLLTFHSDLLGDGGGVIYEAEVELTLE
jgi:hypothetical protein